jgi:hypothetical protein
LSGGSGSASDGSPASEAAAPATSSGLKKQPKVRKMTKDLTPDEQRKESKKRTGRRVAM